MVVHKFVVPGRLCRNHPIGSKDKILRFGIQGDDMVFWVLRDPEDTDVHPIIIYCVNTGEDVLEFVDGMTFEDHFEYADTVSTEEGIVWHVFVYDPIAYARKLVRESQGSFQVGGRML